VLPVVAKVADFGLRRSLAPNATHISTQSHGTVTHVAPEVLTSSHMGLASDVYSFGILMWEVYCCKPPFEVRHVGAGGGRVSSARCPQVETAGWEQGAVLSYLCNRYPLRVSRPLTWEVRERVVLLASPRSCSMWCMCP
jgi:serine/threonine protein kinase